MKKKKKKHAQKCSALNVSKSFACQKQLLQPVLQGDTKALRFSTLCMNYFVKAGRCLDGKVSAVLI